jgi:hypothetical protein
MVDDGRLWAAMAERLGLEILKVLGQKFSRVMIGMDPARPFLRWEGPFHFYIIFLKKKIKKLKISKFENKTSAVPYFLIPVPTELPPNFLSLSPSTHFLPTVDHHARACHLRSPSSANVHSPSSAKTQQPAVFQFRLSSISDYLLVSATIFARAPHRRSPSPAKTQPPWFSISGSAPTTQLPYRHEQPQPNHHHRRRAHSP